MQTIKSVITLTMNPSIDVFGETERLVDGAKNRCGEPTLAPGGGGINVARGIHLLGGKALALFPAGGTNGDKLEQLVTREQVPYQRVEVTAETRQNVAVRETSTDKLFHLVFDGPRFDEQQWRQCLSVLNDMNPVPDYLVLSGSLPPGVPDDFYARVSDIARHHASRVVLDTSGEALQPALYSGVYLTKLNRSEFARFGVDKGASQERYFDAMEELVQAGKSAAVIVTLGPEGALLVDDEGHRLHAAPPPVKGISPVGAGDSFVAVTVYQLAKGNSRVEAFRYGVAAAAAAVQTHGNRLYSTDAIERMYQKMDQGSS